MRRTKNRQKADAILASDLHIRGDVPICRTDDYIEAQDKKLNFMFELCQTNDCPLLIAGDIGHVSQWPNRLLERFISIASKYAIDIIGIPGQHDLPQHKIDNLNKSGCGVLNACGTIQMINVPVIYKDKFIINPFPWGKKIVEARNLDLPNVAMSHQMVIENKLLWPGQIAPKGNQLIKKFVSYQLILTGDNHSSFVSECDNRWLVNAGSMMRMTAAQREFKPSIYKWFIGGNRIENVRLPIHEGVVSREHLKNKKNREESMSTFTSKIEDEVESTLFFEKNMESYLNKHRTKKQVKNKIWEAIENG